MSLMATLQEPRVGASAGCRTGHRTWFVIQRCWDVIEESVAKSSRSCLVPFTGLRGVFEHRDKTILLISRSCEGCSHDFSLSVLLFVFQIKWQPYSGNCCDGRIIYKNTCNTNITQTKDIYIYMCVCIFACIWGLQEKLKRFVGQIKM